MIVEAVDHLGSPYEIRRILGHDAEVFVGGVLRRGVAIGQSIIRSPLYFGQKDLWLPVRTSARILSKSWSGNHFVPFGRASASSRPT